MKNTKHFESIYRSLVWDVCEMLQIDYSLIKGDLCRIIQLSKERGFENIFLITLPNISKNFEKSLDVGFWKKMDGPLMKGGFPSFFLPIFDRIFTQTHRVLLEDPDTEAIRHLRQLLKVFKKLDIDPPKSKTKEKYDEFRAIESELPEPALDWGGTDLFRNPFGVSLSDIYHLGLSREGQPAGEPYGEGSLERDLSFIQFISDKVARSFTVCSRSFKPKHGPGAVSEKFSSSKFEFPSWVPRLEAEFPFSEWGCLNALNIPLEECTGHDSCRLIGVPKDYNGPRLIASEPISSQYIQQGILGCLRSSLKKTPLRFSYDPKTQDPSRSAAIEGSVDGSLSTIDLSSASDRLSCYVVERIFRRNPKLLRQLNAARTPKVLMPDGSTLELKKFAAQGAAFTFPIQSIVYTLVCVGVMAASNPGSRLTDLCRKVRVFGDDIIVETKYYSRVCRALSALFLRVNPDKSFSEGLFRESCGMDAYSGHDVSIVSVINTYNSRDPSKTVSVVDASNNLFMKGYIRASATLQDTLPRKLRDKIPYVLPGTDTSLGLVSFGFNQLKTRYNVMWQCTEVLVLVVESKVKRTVPSGALLLFQRFIENPSPDRIWSGGQVVSVKARYRLRWVPSSQLGR